MIRTVSPFRARSKRRAARSRAAGGREDGFGEVEGGGWTAPSGFVGGDVVVFWADAAEAADWP